MGMVVACCKSLGARMHQIVWHTRPGKKTGRQSWLRYYKALNLFRMAAVVLSLDEIAREISDFVRGGDRNAATLCISPQSGVQP
jgi:hypothetical protein